MTWDRGRWTERRSVKLAAWPVRAFWLACVWSRIGMLWVWFFTWSAWTAIDLWAWSWTVRLHQFFGRSK